MNIARRMGLIVLGILALGLVTAYAADQFPQLALPIVAVAIVDRGLVLGQLTPRLSLGYAVVTVAGIVSFLLVAYWLRVQH